MVSAFLKLIWSRVVPAKVSSFGWRVYHVRLNTRDNLLGIEVILELNVDSCPLCKGG